MGADGNELIIAPPPTVETEKELPEIDEEPPRLSLPPQMFNFNSTLAGAIAGAMSAEHHHDVPLTSPVSVLPPESESPVSNTGRERARSLLRKPVPPFLPAVHEISGHGAPSSISTFIDLEDGSCQRCGVAV